MFEISRPFRRHNNFSLTLLLILILPVAAWAQVSTTGKITGVVTDASGATLATATVTVKSPSLMADRSERAQPDGSYLFDLLPPGTYEVTVTANGFQTLRQTGIVITAGFTATLNSRLRVGQVQETVEVSGEPAVDVQSVQAQSTFDQELLQGIPAGRDPWSTVAQMPGVTSTTFDVGGNQSFQQSTMQVHGQDHNISSGALAPVLFEYFGTS